MPKIVPQINGRPEHTPAGQIIACCLHGSQYSFYFEGETVPAQFTAKPEPQWRRAIDALLDDTDFFNFLSAVRATNPILANTIHIEMTAEPVTAATVVKRWNMAKSSTLANISSAAITRWNTIATNHHLPIRWATNGMMSAIP